MDETVFLAHIAEDGREQTVDEHERGTAELCAKFAAQFGAEEHAKLEAMRQKHSGLSAKAARRAGS